MKIVSRKPVPEPERKAKTPFELRPLSDGTKERLDQAKKAYEAYTGLKF